MTDARGADGREIPLVSVVIASVNGGNSIECCLQALHSGSRGIPFEVVVVDCCDAVTRATIRRFPSRSVRLVEVEGRPSIPRLRAIGMAAAHGKMIAILEDHCNVGPDWFAAVERAWQAGHGAVGGVIENGATERLIDWAIFFCEYARFMPPVQGGKSTEITGNNSLYRRELLEHLETTLDEDVWEFFLHRRLQEMGVDFWIDPHLIVTHEKVFGFFSFVAQRYHYSRSFAGMRLEDASKTHRLAYACATPLLFPLLFWRITRTVWRKGRFRSTLLRSVPLILTFLVPWVWGEAVGALFGPGDSSSKVE